MNNDTPADAITVTQADIDIADKAIEYTTFNEDCRHSAATIAAAIARTPSLAAQDGLVDALRKLRDAGWMVAVHNDYRLCGNYYTFWLFTHPDGRWIKGEGETDTVAVEAALASIEVKSS